MEVVEVDIFGSWGGLRIDEGFRVEGKEKIDCDSLAA